MAEDEDYGDYVTRCVCGFTHDDGYMICCDQCSVWQHVECMKVNPKNLPDKYLCELCEPRPVDKKKARITQLKKREDISDFDENDSSSDRGHSVSRSDSMSPHPPSIKKRRKPQRTSSGGTLRVHELKAEARRSKKEKGEREDGRRTIKKSKHHNSTPIYDSPTPPHSMMSGLQTLLKAASKLEEQQLQIEKTPITPSSLFNCTNSPWKDPYKTIDNNLYTELLRNELRDRMEQLKKEAVVYSKEDYNSLGSFPLCLVRDVGTNRKGLISEAHIPEDEMISEYKAKITLKEPLCKEMDIPSQLLWKQKPCPFVFQYDKMSDIIVCLDARHHGNTARFIRRSCTPNTELRHFFVGDDIHFGIYATNHISPEEEVAVPFDFPYNKCDYPLECACGRRNSCHVTSRGVRTRKSKKEPVIETEQVHVPTETPPISKKPNIKSRLLGIDEDSNSSWTSIGSHTRKRKSRTLSQSSISQQNSRDPTDSESEDIDNELAKKRKSREERKTEALWKMFEKMQAKGKKKLVSVSDIGSNEDNVAAPRTDNKERRFSGHSRKVQLLPPGKHHLSSVSSSVELLSPEHPDAFSSPPLTPSFSFNTHHQDSLDHNDSNNIISPPFATLPKLSFEVTPFLHPKYLLADFALPRKKAILRQWETEQKELLTVEDNGHWMNNGFALACIQAMEGNRPRQRGCLKHRWLDMHSKELQDETEMLLRLPGKKRFLQKWIENCSQVQSTTVGTPPTSLTPPPSSSSSPSRSSSAVETTNKTAVDTVTELINPVPLHTIETEPIKPHPVAVETIKPHPVAVETIKPHPPSVSDDVLHDSPLFDDFSDDDDFEDIHVHVTEKHDRGRIGDTKRERLYKQNKEFQMEDGIENTPFDKEDNENLSTPMDSKIIVTIQSPTTSISSKHFESISPESVSSILYNKSDNPKIEENNDIEEISGDEDDQQMIEMDLSSPHPTDQSVINTSDINIGQSSSDLGELLSPFNDANSKTATKRKMSLLEYRSRARKPSEQIQRKAPSQEIPPSHVRISPTITSLTPPTSINTPPTNHPTSHSFLSYSSSFLSGSSASNRILKPIGQTAASSPTAIATSRLFDNVPQFEPVSPDEGDRTPVIDEVSTPQPTTVTSLLPPPPPPPPPSSNNMSSYNVPPMAAQQMMWGCHPQGHPPGGPILDMSHDPRRVHQSRGPPNPDMYIHHHPPSNQSTMSSQEMIHYPPHHQPHPQHPVPYNTMIHPQQIRSPMGPIPCGPHTPGSNTGNNVFVQQHPRMPHPPLLHQAPPPHHPNNYY